MNKLKELCAHSLTIFWSYVLSAAGAILSVLPDVVGLLADPTVSSAVTGALPSRWVGVYTIGLAVVTYKCRMRSIGAP